MPQRSATTIRDALANPSDDIRQLQSEAPDAVRNALATLHEMLPHVPPSVADIEAHITEWREAIIMLDQAGEESDDGDDDYTMCSCGSMPPLSAPRFDSRAVSSRAGASSQAALK